MAGFNSTVDTDSPVGELDTLEMDAPSIQHEDYPVAYILKINVTRGGKAGRFAYHRLRSRARYWTASARCSTWIFRAPVRSAIVRATFKIRS